MNPITFSESGSSGSDVKFDQGWTPVYNHGGPQGVHHDNSLRTDKLTLTPIPAPKVNPVIQKKSSKFFDKTPNGTHRKEVNFQNLGGDPVEQKLPFDQPSPGTRDYYFAPGNPGTAGSSAAVMSGLRPLVFGGDGYVYTPPMAPADGETTFGTSDLEVTLGKDGFNNREEDSNFSQKPKTWRFRKDDKAVNMLEGPNQTSSPLPPDTQRIGNESLDYPLQGMLTAAVQFPEGQVEITNLPLEPKGPQVLKAPGKEDKFAFGVIIQYVSKPATKGSEEQIQDIYLQYVLEKKTANARYYTLDLETLQAWEAEQDKRGAWSGNALKPLDAVSTVRLANYVAKNTSLLQDSAKMLGLPSQPTEKVQPGKGRGYNVLADPALEKVAPGIQDAERLFTTIRHWDADGSYATSGDYLDAGTTQLLKAKPEGDGTYFKWVYSSPEKMKQGLERMEKRKAAELEKNAPKKSEGGVVDWMLNKLGIQDTSSYAEKIQTGPEPKGLLIVKKKPAWDEAAKQLEAIRQETTNQ